MLALCAAICRALGLAHPLYCDMQSPGPCTPSELRYAGPLYCDMLALPSHLRLLALRTVHGEHIKLSRDELAHKLEEKYDQVGASPSEFVQGLFLEADRDGDNALSRPELKHLFETLGIRLTDEVSVSSQSSNIAFWRRILDMLMLIGMCIGIGRHI